MALLTAYFDESGIHEGDHYCVVAGFIGNDAQWHAMAADWIPAIKPRSNLHMRKLKWKRYPRRIGQLLTTLGPIPARYNLTPVAVGLKWSDYNAIVKGKLNPRFTNPYSLCALLSIAVVLEEIAGADSVHFLFDRQEGMRKETMEMIRNVAFDLVGVDSRIAGLDFINRTKTVCLDPADYLAFILREQTIDENSIKAQLGESIATRRPHGGAVSSEQLAAVVEDMLADGFTIDGRPNKLPDRTVQSLVSNPYWRGPK